jgi:LacI family transcriptional regulator
MVKKEESSGLSSYRPVTIKDIANVLGMSHSTVSRALNDHIHTREETKELVKQTAKELGYVVNSSALIMRGEPGSLIGLVIPDIQNDFYMRIAKVLTDRFRSANLRMVLAITEDDPEMEENEILALVGARAAGIVVTPTAHPTERSATLLKGVPTVQLVRRAKSLPGTLVAMQDSVAVREATAHLLLLGHRRIGYVGGNLDITPGRARWRGFVEAHRQFDVAVDEMLTVLTNPRQDYGYSSMSKLLCHSKKPSAVVIGSSELTIGSLKAIQEAGLSIPGDLSVVGYGDPVWFDLLSPRLTGIRLPVDELADATAADLLSQIEAPGLKMTAPKKQGLRPTLIIRGSTAAFSSRA